MDETNYRAEYNQDINYGRDCHVFIIFSVRKPLENLRKAILKSIRSNNHPILGLGSKEGQGNVSYDYC